MPRTLLCGKEAGRAILPGQLITVKMTPPGGCAKAPKQTTKQRKSWVNLGGKIKLLFWKTLFSFVWSRPHVKYPQKEDITRSVWWVCQLYGMLDDAMLPSTCFPNIPCDTICQSHCEKLFSLIFHYQTGSLISIENTLNGLCVTECNQYIWLRVASSTDDSPEQTFIFRIVNIIWRTRSFFVINVSATTTTAFNLMFVKKLQNTSKVNK